MGLRNERSGAGQDQKGGGGGYDISGERTEKWWRGCRSANRVRRVFRRAGGGKAPLITYWDGEGWRACGIEGKPGSA